MFVFKDDELAAEIERVAAEIRQLAEDTLSDKQENSRWAERHQDTSENATDEDETSS